MDWSYELLSDAERDAARSTVGLRRRLHAGRRGRRLPLGPGRRIDDLVERLVEASLVVPEERDGETRYRLLETVRQYAAERLELRGETAAVRQCHAEHFLTLAESVRDPWPWAASRPAAARRGHRQHPDRLGVRRRVRRRGVGASARRSVVAVLARPWPPGGGSRSSRVGDRSPGSPAHDAYTRAVFGAGILAWSVGDYGRVRVLANELLESATATNSRSDEHAAYKLLSHVTLRERDFAAAERYSKRTLALARKLENDHDVSTAQLNLAVVYLDWGKTEAAIAMLEDVLAYNRRIGNAEGAGFALLNLGEADYHLGDFARARVRFEEARQAFASVGFRAHVGHALTGLAGVEASSGRHGRRPSCSVVRMRCWKRSAPPRTTSIRRWPPRLRRRLGRTSARTATSPPMRTGGAWRPLPRR